MNGVYGSAGLGGTVQMSSVYGGPRIPYAMGPMGTTAPAAVQAGPGSVNVAANGTAPAIAFLGILVGLVAIRIMYEMGGKID